MSEINSRIIVALDFSTSGQALAFVDQVTPAVCRLKVGKQLFTAEGPGFVKLLVQRGFDVFLDLKFHDIPNTVYKAVAAGCELGVWMLNVHALGGREMMSSARKAVDSIHSTNPPKIIAVSILTSTSQDALHELGINKSVQQAVSGSYPHVPREWTGWYGVFGAGSTGTARSIWRKTTSGYTRYQAGRL